MEVSERRDYTQRKEQKKCSFSGGNAVKILAVRFETLTAGIFSSLILH